MSKKHKNVKHKSIKRKLNYFYKKRGYRKVGIGSRNIHYIADKIILFRLLRKIHGRFWGLATIFIMLFFFFICFAIRPDMIKVDTALSDFGRDVRTAPYLAAALFFGAYGQWRWRNYLRRTLKHARPVTTLVTTSVLGLYVAAFFPVAWEPIPYKIHIAGVMLFGFSIALVVVSDTLLSKVRKKRGYGWWRFLRFLSFMMIVVGGYITYGSASLVGWYELSLLGESLMFIGYSIWIIDKTYRGEGNTSRLSKIFKGLVLID